VQSAPRSGVDIPAWLGMRRGMSTGLDAYPYGMDYEWCAMDEAGNIAIFTAAGIGPIPLPVLQARALTDLLTNEVPAMPVRGGARLQVSLPRPDDFMNFAVRGFYAYDWQDVHRTSGMTKRYELVAYPDAPIHLKEIPERLQAMLMTTKIAGVRFAECPSLDVRKYFECGPAVSP
jgi:hypothetical protein